MEMRLAEAVDCLLAAPSIQSVLTPVADVVWLKNQSPVVVTASALPLRTKSFCSLVLHSALPNDMKTMKNVYNFCCLMMGNSKCLSLKVGLEGQKKNQTETLAAELLHSFTHPVLSFVFYSILPLVLYLKMVHLKKMDKSTATFEIASNVMPRS
jgi:hypothetical protein